MIDHIIRSIQLILLIFSPIFETIMRYLKSNSPINMKWMTLEMAIPQKISSLINWIIAAGFYSVASRCAVNQHNDENINFEADFKSYLAHCELLNCNDDETTLKLSHSIEIIRLSDAIDAKPRPTLENWLINQKKSPNFPILSREERRFAIQNCIQR